MYKIKVFLSCILLLSASHVYADNVKSFTDSEGDHISCKIDKTGETSCSNEQGESVICANTDKGYSCSAN